jgi:glyoxylate reductase
VSGGVVLATRALPEPFDALREDFEVRVLGYAAGELELAAEVPGVDALVCLVDDAVTANVIQAADRLKIIASYAVGVDQIDRAAAAARGIVVTNTPNALTDATADLTLALLLALSRRVIEGDRLVRVGGFAGWAPDLLLGRDLKGRVFGIVGPGRIGKAVARRAKAFGMTVIAAGRTARDEGDPDDPPRVSFDELLRRSDVVSIHVPLNDETRGLFQAETFAKMKPGSLLLNTARGQIVDEVALTRASTSTRTSRPSHRPCSTTTASCSCRTPAAPRWRRAGRWPAWSPKTSGGCSRERRPCGRCRPKEAADEDDPEELLRLPRRDRRRPPAAHGARRQRPRLAAGAMGAHRGGAALPQDRTHGPPGPSPHGVPPRPGLEEARRGDARGAREEARGGNAGGEAEGDPALSARQSRGCG